MNLKLNGKEITCTDAATITDLIAHFSLCPEKIVVELNGYIPEKETWENVKLQENDSVEIVSFVGGG